MSLKITNTKLQPHFSGSNELILDILNSLTTLGRCGCDFKSINLKYNLWVDILSIQVYITLEWMPDDLVDGSSQQ